MSSRGNPFEELERMFERMSRQFENASNSWEIEAPFGQWRMEAEAMAVDLAEADDEFVVTVDLPGFERDDVEVRVTDQTLRVEADHEEHEEAARESYLRRERRHESLHRTLRLPGPVDAEGVTARMHNGVLTVTLPKTESEEARTIDID